MAMIGNEQVRDVAKRRKAQMGFSDKYNPAEANTDVTKIAANAPKVTNITPVARGPQPDTTNGSLDLLRQSAPDAKQRANRHEAENIADGDVKRNPKSKVLY